MCRMTQNFKLSARKLLESTVIFYNLPDLKNVVVSRKKVFD